MADEAGFPVVDITSWAWEMFEPMGKPGKRWLFDPDGRSWLWKPVTIQREASTSFPKEALHQKDRVELPFLCRWGTLCAGGPPIERQSPAKTLSDSV
jgi:hypothetical protein